MKKKSKNQVTNPLGMEVRKCCASCKFKDILGMEAIRTCTKKNKEVKKQDLCAKWRIRESFRHIHYTDGKVKSKAYLKMVLKIRLQEQTLIEQGKMKPEETASVESLRQLFQQQFDQSLYTLL